MINTLTAQTIKDRIVNYVEIHHGMKHSDLFNKISSEYLNISSDDILKMIHELVQERRIHRLEYVVTNYPSTIFNFYLPEFSRVL